MAPRAPRVPPLKFKDDEGVEEDLEELKREGLPHGQQSARNSGIGRAYAANGFSDRPNTNRGRPRAGESFAEIMRAELEREVGSEGDEPTTYKGVIVRKFVELAAKGNLMAFIELMNRTEGKVPDKLQADMTHSMRVVPWDDDDAGIVYLENPGFGEKPETAIPPDVALRDQPALPPPEGSEGDESDGYR